ncbi:Exocyst complex component EXO84 [Escovopsis weberi]|uniref:Exocyst complex component EXO84 n=1 Tax=Escovopsis weberi TaxID=150374 RepID=A0A0M8N249_ESCWE|nr:Exocyst complex component EXO84 [Escovopsis weberi]
MSEERSKILSLRSGPKRKARPVISAPRQISAPVIQDEPPEAVMNAGTGPALVSLSEAAAAAKPRRPGATGTKTSDLVKRRYSTRFGQIPAGYDANVPPVPGLPPMPAFDQYEYKPPPSRGGPGAAPVVDIKALRDPQLAPDQYVAGVLSEASEDQIREYEESLRSIKSRAATDLQQSLLQNRTQFIKISKEAEKLKSEMRALRTLMSELKANTTALRAASGRDGDDENSIGRSTMSKRDKRSSVADRSALWNTQMQSMYKNVEGLQKFLPNSLGRHVVQNAGPWIELDNATYKSRRAIQIFLLNDHLLIASRKKRKVDTATADPRLPMTKLVADRCWPLLDIEIIDMPGSGDYFGGRNKLADAIMVRGGGQESFIYRTEKPDGPEKKQLMMGVRKAVEELRKGLQSEMEANNKARETINYFASRDPGLLQKTELLETLSDIKDMHIEVDGKQQNLRWVESEMDELDIEIALQSFEPAVVRVEKLLALARGLKNNAVAQDFISFKVEERCAKLAAIIIRSLKATHNQQNKANRDVGWLTRLGYEDRAREAYLAARSETIHKRARQCIFQGDLHLYIWQLSFAYFTIIHNTVQCFQACFPPPMMSACVKWAKEEVDAFNEVLARQLSSTEPDGAVWTQCMDQAKEHAKLLSEVGLDFMNRVGRNLKETVPAGSEQQEQQEQAHEQG